MSGCAWHGQIVHSHSCTLKEHFKYAYACMWKATKIALYMDKVLCRPWILSAMRETDV
jgi:hypothetical protein